MNVPNVTATNIVAIMIMLAVEYSGIVDTVTVRLVGTNIAWMPVVSVTFSGSGLAVYVLPPAAVAVTQHKNLKPSPAVAWKLDTVPIV